MYVRIFFLTQLYSACAVNAEAIFELDRNKHTYVAICTYFGYL